MLPLTTRLSLSEELTSCCAAGTNGCLDLRRCTLARDGLVSRWPGSMAQCAIDSVAPLQRSSAGWMPERIVRLSAGSACRHSVTIRMASLMAGSMRQVWALRHQTRAQYYAVECTRAGLAVRRVVSPAAQPEPASHLRRMISASCETCCRWINGYQGLSATTCFHTFSISTFWSVWGSSFNGNTVFSHSWRRHLCCS